MTQPPEFPPRGQPSYPPPPPPHDPPAAPYTAAPVGYPPPYTPYPLQPGHNPAPGTNGLSIAALITGIIGFFLASIPLAIVGLRQIKRTGQSGRGLAIAGLVLSGVWMVGFTVVGIVVAVVVDNYVDRDDSGVIVESGWMFVEDLRVGDCTGDEATGDSVWKIEGVPCEEPHVGEVYAILDIDDRTLPSDDNLDERCKTRLEEGFPKAWADADVLYSWIGPSPGSWDTGDRSLVCYAVTESPRAGSVLD